MVEKLTLKAKKLDFNLATPQEICCELSLRLKTYRLLRKLKQVELAKRAGVSLGTVKNLETKGQCSLETIVRLAIALGLTQSLSSLFEVQAQTIAQMEEIEELMEKKLPKRIR